MNLDFLFEKIPSSLTCPVIEDCAHGFTSQNVENSVGTWGSFVIISLPKFFPLQFGGILVSQHEPTESGSLTPEELQYVKTVCSHYVPEIKAMGAKRRENYRYLESAFKEKFQLDPSFSLRENIIPGVFKVSFPKS